MTSRPLFAAAIIAALAQIPGCHFYVRAMPEIIISDSPIPIPPAPNPQPKSD